MNASDITIGFPTYMRREAIVARLKTLIADPLVEGHPLLVIDNGSTDGTYEAIQAECGSGRLTLLRNDTNIGIVRNLTRLFRECRTEYLLLMSDEDGLHPPHLEGLLDLIRREAPLFVSPQALTDGKVYRGRTSGGPIEAEDFLKSSFYISGLVYHRETTARFVDELDSLEATSAAGRLYPLVVLALNVMLQGQGRWYPEPLVEKVQKLPTRISDLNGSPYNQLPSRWRQHMDFLRYFEEFQARGLTEERASLIERMRQAMLSSVFGRVTRSIGQESPESLEAFHRTAREYYLNEAGDAGSGRSGDEVIADLRKKLENFRGMVERRDAKIAKLMASSGTGAGGERSAGPFAWLWRLSRPRRPRE